jgi:hypothetical protein
MGMDETEFRLCGLERQDIIKLLTYNNPDRSRIIGVP